MSLTRETPEARRMYWYVSANLSQPSQFDQFMVACETGPLTNELVSDYLSQSLLANGSDGYNHDLPPNLLSCYPDAFNVSIPFIFPPTSEHAGGVNLLLMDGSVRFVGSSVNRDTWHALGTRNGHETTGTSF